MSDNPKDPFGVLDTDKHTFADDVKYGVGSVLLFAFVGVTVIYLGVLLLSSVA